VFLSLQWIGNGFWGKKQGILFFQPPQKPDYRDE